MVLIVIIVSGVGTDIGAGTCVGCGIDSDIGVDVDSTCCWVIDTLSLVSCFALRFCMAEPWDGCCRLITPMARERKKIRRRHVTITA